MNQGQEERAELGGEERDLDDESSDGPDDQFLAEDDLTKIRSQDDPDRMKLTEQEHGHAMDIKDIVEASPDLDNMSDFMYAQLAIICKDDVEDAVRRCYGMQEFQREYKIVHNYEQGWRFVGKMVELFPRQNIAFAFSEKDGHYFFIHDITKFDPKLFTSSAMGDDWLIGMYYIHFIFQPDLECVRKGVVVMVECEGMNMRTDVLKHFSAFYSQFLVHYPFYGRCRHYHTGTWVNVGSSILRRILPKEIQDAYQVGLRFDGNLGDAFLTPTVQEANKRLIVGLNSGLRLRFQNESIFSLE